MRDLETSCVKPHHGLDTQADAFARAQPLPAGHGLLGSLKQRLRIADRVRHAQGHPIGRTLARQLAAAGGLIELEAPTQVRVESGLAIGRRRLAIDLGRGHFGKSRPVAPLGTGLHRALDQPLMSFKQAHGQSPLCHKKSFICRYFVSL